MAHDWLKRRLWEGALVALGAFVGFGLSHVDLGVELEVGFEAF